MIRQTDPINQLADNIVDSISQIASCKATKASYDKTFVVTILGVGQDFTDDVTQAEQESLIKKYNIPAVSTDNSTYFTFKLEGIYYSVKQNGDFKLYEQTLLRVPNNNWDRMFLERLGVGNTNAGNNGVHLFTDIQEPPIPSEVSVYFGQKNKLIQQGDTYIYWVVATDIGNYEELYVANQEDDDGLYYWEKVKMVCSATAPQIDSKEVAEINGKYYWLEIKDKKVVGICKVKKESVEGSDEYRYAWNTDASWSFDSEFEDYSVTREYSLPTRYSGIINGYKKDEYNPCVYLSDSAPVQIGDLWYKISDFLNCELMQICEHKVGITGKQSWQIVCNIAGNGEGEYYYGHNIIVSDVEPKPIPDVNIPDEYKHSRPDIGSNGEIYTTCTLKTVGDKLTINFIQAYMYHYYPLKAGGEWERKDFFVYYPDEYLNDEKREKLIIPDENDMSRVGKIAIIVAYDYDFFDSGYRNIYVYEYIKKDNKWGKDMLGVFPSRGAPLTESDIEYIGNGTSINDGDYWAKVNNMTDKKLMSFHECVGGKWNLLYTAYTPTIYALSTDPTLLKDNNNEPIYNVQVGDYWAKTDGDSSKNITEFYQRISTIDEQTQEPVESWEKMFNCSGGGGGETVTINIQNAIIVDKEDVIHSEEQPL